LCILGQDLGDKKYAFPVAGNRVPDEFLVAVELGRIDQGHPERNARAQGLCMSFLLKPHRALTKRRDDSAVAEFDRTSCAVWGRGESR
jgi:hypothetical protein